MIQYTMLVALGFLVASLLALVLAPPLWRRAVRLTTSRLQATMPMSPQEIQAEKDQLRAEFAMETRRLELALESARDASAKQLVEINRRKASIKKLRAQIKELQALADERKNASAVLEQTVRKKLPELETELNRANTEMNKRLAEVRELAQSLLGREQDLARTTKLAEDRKRELDLLRKALTEAESPKGTGKALKDIIADLDALRAENKDLKKQLAAGVRPSASTADLSDENVVLLRDEMHKLADQILEHAETSSDPQGKASSAAPKSKAGASGGRKRSAKAAVKKTGATLVERIRSIQNAGS